jgi:predicted transposase/invertase (TIGR01784 family)
MRNTVRFDWAIKRLLRNKANFDILEGFLSELLGDDVRIESILESEGNREHADNKTNRVDMLVQNTSGELLIVEVQSNYMHDYLMRMVYGTSRLIVDHMDKGMSYSKIKKVISINIVYFDLGHGKDYVYHGTTTFTGIYKHDVLTLSRQEQEVFHTPLIEKIYPEYYIIKVNQFDDVAKNTLDEWIDFLKNERVNEYTQAKGLLAAREKLDVMKLTPEERRDYERDMDNERDNASVIESNYRKGQLEGIEMGVAQGIGIGMETRDKEIIKRGAAMGMSIDDLAALTGRTEDEIRAVLASK